MQYIYALYDIVHTVNYLNCTYIRVYCFRCIVITQIRFLTFESESESVEKKLSQEIINRFC